MKKLMMTTALVAVTSMGAVAQTADTGMTGDAGMAEQGANVQAFLVSDFTGKSLHTLDPGAAQNQGAQLGAGGQQTGMHQDQRGMRWQTAQDFGMDSDQWEDVGNIDDVILTRDGDVRGVLVDVGGFLGIGARTVMVDIEDLHFVLDDSGWLGTGGTTGGGATGTGTDTAQTGTTQTRAAGNGDIDDFSVVVMMTRDQLEALPEWDDAQLQAGFERRNMQTGAGMQQDAAAQDQDVVIIEPDQQDTATTQAGQQGAAQQPGQDGMVTATSGRTEIPEGYRVVEQEERSAEMILGANVYGREGEEIATVEDLIIGDNGELTHAVMDVGGFVGMGTHTVAIEIDDVDILYNDQNDSVRIHVTMTEEELESLPEFQG